MDGTFDLSFTDNKVSKKTKSQVKKMLAKMFRKEKPEPKPGQRIISYSQISKFHKCPRQWELSSYRKVAPSEPGIHAVFGTAIHNTIQQWLVMCNDVSISEASKQDWNAILLKELTNEYQKSYIKFGAHFSNRDELSEFYSDGVKILAYLFKNRTELFNSKNYELVAVELPLFVPLLDEYPNIILLSYLDIVLYDRRDETFLVIDLKSSTRGWKDYDKKDRMKTGQLVLYKKYLSKQYSIPEDKIQIQYLILKRKLYEESLFAQKRIQKFSPPDGPRITKQLIGVAEDFILKAFDRDGNYLDKKHPAIAGVDYNNCKWCQFSEDEINCPKSNRICI